MSGIAYLLSVLGVLLATHILFTVGINTLGMLLLKFPDSSSFFEYEEFFGSVKHDLLSPMNSPGLVLYPVPVLFLTIAWLWRSKIKT